MQTPVSEFLSHILYKRDCENKEEIISTAIFEATREKNNLLEKRIIDLEEGIKDLRIHHAELRKTLLFKNKKIEEVLVYKLT